jgi:hypothetical protein
MIKKYATILALGLLITSQCFAATAQVNNVLLFPNITFPFTQLTKLRNLVAGYSANANNFLSLANTMSPGSTAQYQVTTGKTLVCFGAYVTTGVGAGSADSIRFGYGTAALGSDNTSTPPTGVVYYAGSTATSSIAMRVGGANTNTFYPFPMSFPANSYPTVQVLTTDTYSISLPCEECVPGTDC